MKEMPNRVPAHNAYQLADSTGFIFIFLAHLSLSFFLINLFLKKENYIQMIEITKFSVTLSFALWFGSCFFLLVNSIPHSVPPVLSFATHNIFQNSSHDDLLVLVSFSITPFQINYVVPQYSKQLAF